MIRIHRILASGVLGDKLAQQNRPIILILLTCHTSFSQPASSAMKSTQSIRTELSISLSLRDDIRTLGDLSQAILDICNGYGSYVELDAATASEEAFEQPIPVKESAKIRGRFQTDNPIVTWGDVGIFYEAWLEQSVLGNLIEDCDDVQSHVSALGLDPKCKVRLEEILDLYHQAKAATLSDDRSRGREIADENAHNVCDREDDQASLEAPLTSEQSEALGRLLDRKLAQRELKLPWIH